MRSRSAFLCALLIVIAAGAGSQTTGSKEGTGAANTASIEGVWRAQMDGLPAITLTITDESGSLSGAVLFYLHRRDEGRPVTATPGVPEPLFSPKFDGKILTFQVSHRRAHPPDSLQDAPVSFRLKLTGPDKGEFVNENEENPNAPVFVLVRSEY
jgi:hypothetical protein